MVKKVKRIVSLALTLCILMSCVAIGSFTTQAATSASGIDYGLVDYVQNGNILHCWNWSYNNLRRNLQKIAEQGFSAVQVSPIQSIKESINESWSTVSNQWWIPYQPIGFTVENSGKGFGSVDEFKALCEEAHKYNIKVIVDVVFNHLANDYGHEGTIHPHVIPEFLTNMDLWHQPLNWQISNYSDRYDITHHSLSALPDLNTGHDTVQWYAGGYLKELISYGADGFRFDAAKHIETPGDADGTRSEFWYNVLSTATSYAQSTRGFTPYYYGEILDGTGGVDIGAYTYYMSVTDSGGSRNIRDGVMYGDTGKASQSYSNNGAAADRTVLWNESHDEYAGGSNYTRTIDSWHLNKTWAMMGSRNQTAALYLARPNNFGSTMVGDADATAWTSKEVQAVNQFRNRFCGQGEYMATSGSFAYNVRGNSGVVIVNTGQNNGSATVNIPSCGMADGTYLDAITGNQFTVSYGYIKGEMGSSGIAVVYNKGPQASISPASTAYRSSSITLTLHTEYADYGRYSFDGETFYDFTDGDKITIGADKAVGKTTSVYIQSVNMWGEYSNLECYYYWKLASDQEQLIYFNNSKYGYSSPYAYFYHKDTDTAYKSWPGVKMSIDENTDMPYVDVPKGYEGAHVIINDSSSGRQTPSGDGYKLNGDTVIIDNDYTWPYTPVTTEGIRGDLYLRTNNWGNDGAQLMAYVWTGSNNALVPFEPVGSCVYKASLPTGVWKRVNFLRVSADATAENIWDNVWNQSSQMIPTGQNFFSMYDDSWDGSGVWGVYDDSLTDSSVSLAGDFNGWDLNATKMEQNSGVNYSATVTLDQGTYKFKVVQYGLWNGSSEIIDDSTSAGVKLSSSAGECTIQASGGDYTFTYNSSTQMLTVSYVPGATTAQPNEGDASAMTIAGDFNGWDSLSTVMTYTSDPSIVTATMDIAAGTYNFKLVKDNLLWYGNGETVADTTTGTTLSSTGSDVVLEASGGSYTFNYNLKTYELVITADLSSPPATNPTTPSTPTTPEVTTQPAMCISGDFNSWSTTSDMMTYTSTNVASITMEIAAGTYYFKLVDTDAGLWYGSGTTITDTTTSTAVSATGTECILKASGGTYTFNYNVSTKTMSIDFVAAEGPSIGDVSTASVAGEFNGWDPAADMMTYKSESIVTKTFTLDKGTYEFKIVNGGLWYGNNGKITNTTSNLQMNMTAGNCTLVATGGTYTFDYNIKTGLLSISAVLAAGPSTGEVSTASIAGDFNGWSTTSDMLTYTSSSVASTTMTLDKGTYYFKVVNDGLWYGNNGTIVNTTTTTSSVGWEMSISQNECILEATGGEYTFSYNLETNMLVIEYEPTETTIGGTSAIALAGSFNGWDPTAEMMVYSSATTVKSTVSLTAGSYEFKIVDGYWYGNETTITDTTSNLALSGTAGNVTLQASGGDYTFVFDIATHKLTITFVETEGPAVGSQSVFSVAGEFNDWDKTADMMTYSSDTVVKATFELAKGTYPFKIVNTASGLWYGNDTTITNKTTGLTMSAIAGNCALVASGGTYTFTYNVTTNALTITYVAGDVIEEEVKPGDVSTVSVAGSFNGWDKDVNMMTYKSSDVVTSTISIPRGTYQFKIVDGLWYGNEGAIEDTTTTTSAVGWEMSSTAGDCTLIATGGSYTFEFNLSTKMLVITYVAGDSDVTDEPQISSVALAGDFNDWNTSADMMTMESGNIVTITKTLKAGSYGFKLVDNGSWYGNNGTIVDTTTATSDVGWEMSTGTGNCTLQATGGTYTFRYNTVTHMLVIYKN